MTSKAFLVMFERVTVVARWPKESWASLLATYLTGWAQAAYWGLNVITARDYTHIKAATLDTFNISPEIY